MLRVLHTFAPERAEQVQADVAALREEDGCVSAELYRSQDLGAIACLWRDEPAYWAHWARVIDSGIVPELRTLVDEASTEFYRQEPYVLDAGKWVPAAPPEAERRIFWPARGAVRIIIQGAYNYTPEPTRAEVIATRREPGCEQYDWLENIDLPGHLMLLEVWTDQAIYDRHWQLRRDTVEYRGDSGRTPRPMERGEAVREFYRQQAFAPHYDRWLPAATEEVATTVTWPA